ncbi:D-alanyl-D-alanine carboxypeptidase family protein [Martelella endophytica]|nr:D-alanyl-D-alanine carboxypeptidase family protein [Martelella endophytica]
MAALALAAALASGFAGKAAANPYIVVDANTDRVLFAEEPFRRWYPASLTKLMSAYLAFSDIKAGLLDKNSVVTFSAAAANEPATKMYFAPGARVTLDSALKMMLVHSANDAARALAESSPGGRDVFIQRMNATAAKLGMADTHFVNANGMSSMSNPQPGQYTTARDMAVLALAIERDFPEYLYYFKIPGIASNSGRYRNTNLLIGNFDGATGMKTGYVCASGYNQVSTATRDGKAVVVVALGTMTIPERAELSAKLLQAGLTTTERNGPLISGYLPTEPVDAAVADITSSTCSQAAMEAKAGLIDEDGDYVLNSPYLKPIPDDFATVDAFRLPNDTEMASSTLDSLTIVPLPYARPVQ